jgi:RNA polymerase sigma-70 factor (ECF subfamily)
MSARSHESDETLLGPLRAGDEQAFATLVDRMNGRLLSLARTFTTSPALAEDIVQETWLGVIRGLRGFEGRSSLRTWIFSILVRRACTMAAREARGARIGSEAAGENGNGPEWNPGQGRQGLWNATPVPWGLVDPASLFQSMEALGVIRETVAALPERQRQALLLRDVEDLGAKDVCNVLEITETNLRVLLHRGRARVREALDAYLREGVAPLPPTPPAGMHERGSRPDPSPDHSIHASGEGQ